MDQNDNYDWKAAALHDYQHSGLSAKEIADKYNRNRVTVQKLIARSGLERIVPLVNKGGRVPHSQQHPLSPLHKAIGIELNMHRTLKRKENVTDFSATLMTNRYRLRAMELGLYDFTLSELCRIAEVLQMTPAALMNIKQEVPYTVTK